MTTFSISPAMTLNEVVSRWPATLPVLRRLGLDLCCGGTLSLREAAAHHQLDLAALLAALSATEGQR